MLISNINKKKIRSLNECLKNMKETEEHMKNFKIMLLIGTMN